LEETGIVLHKKGAGRPSVNADTINRNCEMVKSICCVRRKLNSLYNHAENSPLSFETAVTGTE
jgi:hypothetical protein